MGDVAEDRRAGRADVPVVTEPAAVTLAHRRLVDTVLSGGGLPEVAAVVHELVGGVVLVTTADGRVLAIAGDEEARERVRGSAAFADGRFRTEQSTPGVHAADGLDGCHVVVAVTGGRIDHGRLAVFADAAPDAEQVAVLQRAAEVAAIILTKELAVTSVESKYRGDFLRDVLAGRAGTAEEVVTHGRTLGWDLARPVVVVVAALETESGPPMSRGYQGPLEVERFSAAWTGVLAREVPGAPVVGFAAEVVALLPAETAEQGRELVERVTRAVRGDGGGGRRAFAAGVSRPVGRVVELPSAYEQARRAVVAGRRLHGPSAVVHFDDLGVFRLLSLIEDAGELDRFVEETLKELADRGSAEAATLRETLQVLLDTNLNVAETARALHFHYNTLRYRIGKIERVVGPFTKDPHLRLDLALALRVVALRELG